MPLNSSLIDVPISAVALDNATAMLRQVLATFSGKSELSVLDVGAGCESRLEIPNAMQWKCFGVDPDIAEDALVAWQPANATFVVRRVEDMIPHAFDLIFVAKLPDMEQSAEVLLFKLFSIGAITPTTRLVAGVECVAGQATWDRRTLLNKLHFGEVELLARITEDTGVSEGVWESRGALENHGDVAAPSYWVQALGSDFASFMQERYVPGTWSKIAEYEHMPRYALAERLASDKAVLDFGCGTGYGSAILARRASSVVGLDIDAAAMEWARNTHHSSILKFYHCADLGARLPDASFDLITCFEMIEHVDFMTQQATISSIARLLKPDGTLLISTPNPDVTKMYGENPYHLREMTLPQFHELLELHFEHIEILEQRVLNSVTFESPGAASRRFETSVPVNPKRDAAPLAFIAMCGKRNLEKTPATVFFDEETDSIFETLQAEKRANLGKMAIYISREQLLDANAKLSHIAQELQETRAHLTNDIASMAAVLSEKSSAIAAQNQHLDRLGNQLAVSEAALKEKESTALEHAGAIATLQHRLATADKTQEQLTAGIASLAGALNEKTSLIAAKDSVAALQNQDIKRLTDLLAARDERLDDALKAQAREIDRLHQQLAVQSVEIQQLLRIKASKWQRLHDTIKARPLTLRNVVKSVYLIGAMASPMWVRERFGPSIQKLRVKRGAAKQARQAAASAVTGREVSLSTPDAAGKATAVDESAPLTLAADLAPTRIAYAVEGPSELRSHRPRVVHVIANFCVGGSSRLVVDLIECLGAEYEQSIVTSYIPTPPDYSGVQIAEYGGVPDTTQFISHFITHDPDLVHVHYWGDCDKPWYLMAISAAEQLGIPIIENVNTPVAPHFSDGITHYIYVSKYVQQSFGKFGANHHTIFPGSDFKRFHKSPDIRVGDDCIGMVYRLEPDKLNASAILPFIEAVKIRPSTRVLIVGGGSLLTPFVVATKNAGVYENFEFTGYVAYDALPQYYNRMSIFVAPVWKESFGQVSAFAMNMHIPVCGYDVGAIAEIIDEPSLVVPNGDAIGLAHVICELLDDGPRRENLGIKMHRRAQALFSQHAMVDAYARIYDSVVQRITQ